MIRIAVDVYGGDNAPGCVIDGSLNAMEQMPDVSITFFGDEEEATRYHVLSWAIQEMKAKQQWIPCKERLPDKLGTYICTCVENDINHVTFIKWQSRYKRWDLNGRRTFWRVTAWMPLPEPPKGE